MSRLLLLALLLVLSLTAFAQDTSSDEVDYVELAALLMRDGEAARAAEALARADDPPLPRPGLFRSGAL
jgi:hypothetical protein